MRPLALALALVIAAASGARAGTLTVGVFAPAAPFPSTAARVELAGKLADQVGRALGQPASGKVFARAGDFAAAVKKGEIAVALVDATYLAAAGTGGSVIADGVRDGQAAHGWQLVARGGGTPEAEPGGPRPTGGIAALRGKRVLVPAIGGREADFVLDVLLGGEVARDYFAKLETAPDTASALAALALGKADAAVVPDGAPLPAGTQIVLELPALAGPVLVAYGPLAAAQKAALAAAAPGFSGDATVAGFAAPTRDAIRRIAARFTPPVKRGPLVVPAIRLLVGGLVAGRTFTIERTPAAAFAVAPQAK